MKINNSFEKNKVLNKITIISEYKTNICYGNKNMIECMKNVIDLYREAGQ